ncbi:hypothetical protein A2U01_0109580, partial [Trifolium medium]|nr:hypothetical protein [Trifolium medium]
MPESESPRKI